MIEVEGLLKNGQSIKCWSYNLNRFAIIKMCLEDVKVKEMARRLDISRKTVCFHRDNIKKAYDMGRISTAGTAGKMEFKRQLIRQGFSLDVYTNNYQPPAIPELPMGLL